MACACISVQLRKHCSAAVQLPKLFHRGCWATFEAACALLFVLVMDADKYGPCPLPMPQLLGLGPYWVKGGKAPPAPLFTQAETVGALPTALQLQPLEEVQCALTDTPNTGPPVPACSTPRLPEDLPAALVQPVTSLQELESSKVQKWVSLWTVPLGDLIKYSCFSQLGALALDTLQQILSTKAASTLQRHLGGWKCWLEFAGSACASAWSPELVVVVGFFKGLAESSRASDAPLRAMRFAAGVPRNSSGLCLGRGEGPQEGSQGGPALAARGIGWHAVRGDDGSRGFPLHALGCLAFQ